MISDSRVTANVPANLLGAGGTAQASVSGRHGNQQLPCVQRPLWTSHDFRRHPDKCQCKYKRPGHHGHRRRFLHQLASHAQSRLPFRQWHGRRQRDYHGCIVSPVEPIGPRYLQPKRVPLLPITLLLAIVVLRFARARRQRLAGAVPLGGLMFFVLLQAIGCGGGGSAPPPPQGTLAGTYTVTVTGTSET